MVCIMGMFVQARCLPCTVESHSAFINLANTVINICLLAASCGLDRSQMKDCVLIYTMSRNMHDSLCNKLINLYFMEYAGDENDKHRQT